MRSIVTILSFILLCIQLSAQEKIEALKLISDICEKNISIDDFKKQYSDYFIINHDTDSTDSGLFILQNLSFAGYESNGVVFISSDTKMKIVTISPNYEILDSVSRYQVADKYHEYLLTVLGQPDLDDISFDNSTLKQIPQGLNIKESTTYTWFKNTTVPYMSIRYKTNKEDVYNLMAVSGFPFYSTTPIQRQFYKTLEFGKNVTKTQIATALDIPSYIIKEERKSYGRTYRCLESVYFGGVTWSFLEIGTVDGKLATVRLTSSELKDNTDIYDTLLKALTNKYGAPIEDDAMVLWGDGLTDITLSHQYGESKGGEMRHYVDLNYIDTELHQKAQNIIENEL